MSQHPALALALGLTLAACGGGADTTATTLAQATTTIVSETTTTTQATTTTTVPPVGAAVLDGPYVVTIAYEGLDEPPRERLFTFTADCSVDPCRISGEIETARGVFPVEVAFDGERYAWTVNQEVSTDEDGEVLCTWAEAITYEVTVEAAAVRDGSGSPPRLRARRSTRPQRPSPRQVWTAPPRTSSPWCR